MTKSLFSTCRLAPLVCAGIFVLAVSPAGAIQREAEDSASNKSVYENLKRRYDNLNDVEKEQFNKDIVDPMKGVAKDKAKQAVKDGWNKLKNSKTLGPAAKKLAKKYGPAAKKVARFAGPAGQLYNAYNTGQSVGGIINSVAVDPLMSAYFDKKQKEHTRKLEREFADYKRQLEEDKRQREMAKRQEQQRRELERANAELERHQRASQNKSSITALNKHSGASPKMNKKLGDSPFGYERRERPREVSIAICSGSMTDTSPLPCVGWGSSQVMRDFPRVASQLWKHVDNSYCAGDVMEPGEDVCVKVCRRWTVDLSAAQLRPYGRSYCTDLR